MRRRIEAFLGPFGSGKTEVALNRGLLLAADGSPVTLVDLDLVDPFFRARQVRKTLAGAGITVVAPEGEWEDADLPLLIPQVFGALQRPGHVLLDVGGEVQGAIILRQINTLLPEDAEIFLVINPYRPVMGTPERIVEMCRALERAAGVRVTALVSVPHLGKETTREVVRRGHAVVSAASALLGLPVRWVAVGETLAPQVNVGVEVLPLRLFMRPPWEEAGSAEKTGRAEEAGRIEETARVEETECAAGAASPGGGTRGQDRH